MTSCVQRCVSPFLSYSVLVLARDREKAAVKVHGRFPSAGADRQGCAWSQHSHGPKGQALLLSPTFGGQR